MQNVNYFRSRSTDQRSAYKNLYEDDGAGKIFALCDEGFDNLINCGDEDNTTEDAFK